MTESSPDLKALTIAVLGGTGPQGRGLARRFAQAGESAEELQLAALERRLQALQEQASV